MIEEKLSLNDSRHESLEDNLPPVPQELMVQYNPSV
jgi:hypothetical protein